ncbi:MAG: ATP-binding protein [Candidatus Hodarchaeales archaeon]|jgi:ferredoxin
MTVTQEKNAFEALAETLDKIPNGFKTSDDTYLRVLEWIFTEEEADLASKMKLMGETVQDLAARLNISEEGLEEKLETMVEKGQITDYNTRSGRKYGLMPFAVGIYEEQWKRMDKEFAQLCEDYFQKMDTNQIFDTEPAIFRVVPINRVIKPELEIYPYETAEDMLKNAKSWGVRDCICKQQKELIGDPCKITTNKTVCLPFSHKEKYFDDSKFTDPITKEQALEYLSQAENAGLIHCSMNIESGQYYICNCCTCCCGVLRGLTERNQPNAFVNSNFVMSVDEDLCVGCETCVDRCQFDALDVPDDMLTIDLDKCVGCGVCAIVCPEDALELVSRATGEKTQPAKDFMDWMTRKAMSRQVDPSDLM